LAAGLGFRRRGGGGRLSETWLSGVSFPWLVVSAIFLGLKRNYNLFIRSFVRSFTEPQEWKWNRESLLLINTRIPKDASIFQW